MKRAIKALRQAMSNSKLAKAAEIAKPKMWSKLFVIVIFAMSLANCRHYMQEKPDFFVPCYRDDIELDKCLRENLAAYIDNYRYGIPDYPVAGKLEPVHLQRVRFKLHSLKLELRNMTMHGLGGANVTELLLLPSAHSLVIKLSVPKIRVTGNYKVEGNLLFLNFNSKGDFWLETEDTNFVFHTKLRLKRMAASNVSFAVIESLETKLTNVSSLKCNVQNLFNGNEALEEQANELINSSWRDLLQVLRPTFEHTINAIISSRFRKVLNYIPADYFVTDISELEEGEENV